MYRPQRDSFDWKDFGKFFLILIFIMLPITALMDAIDGPASLGWYVGLGLMLFLDDLKEIKKGKPPFWKKIFDEFWIVIEDWKYVIKENKRKK